MKIDRDYFISSLQTINTNLKNAMTEFNSENYKRTVRYLNLLSKQAEDTSEELEDDLKGR